MAQVHHTQAPSPRVALRKPRKRNVAVYRGPECPYCGSTSSQTRASGYSEAPEEYRIRWRGCFDCDRRFTTVEVPVLGTTYYRLDPVHREERRAAEWRRNGYTTPHLEKRVRSDRISVVVSVERRGKD